MSSGILTWSVNNIYIYIYTHRVYIYILYIIDLLNVRKRITLKYRKMFAIKQYACEVHVRVKYLGSFHLIPSRAVDLLYLLLAYKTMMVVLTVFACVLIYRTVLVKVHWSFCEKKASSRFFSISAKNCHLKLWQHISH
jgi:hypothetical protein